ncbi:MAG: hypothetical protein ACXWC9_09655 [Pseudobdellovibrionaceae bacterium]
MSGIHISIAEAYSHEGLKQLFHKPLIVGASVSADYFTESPGKVLALDYTSPERIKVLAQKGKASTHILKNFSESHIEDRSIVIGVDLFFWDSFTSNATASLEQLEKIVHLSEKHKVPLVLGEIPTLLPATQKSALAINKRMRELCQSKSTCYLLPLHGLMEKTLTDGYIDHKGTRYDLPALVPDGIHIAKPASQYLADQIKNLLLL